MLQRCARLRQNASNMGLVSNVYYWDSMQALQALIQHPAHIEAKQRQARWLNGYHIVIARVVGSYGDGRIAHPLAALPAVRVQPT